MEGMRQTLIHGHLRMSYRKVIQQYFMAEILCSNGIFGQVMAISNIATKHTIVIWMGIWNGLILGIL